MKERIANPIFSSNSIFIALNPNILMISNSNKYQLKIIEEKNFKN